MAVFGGLGSDSDSASECDGENRSRVWPVFEAGKWTELGMAWSS